MKRAVLYARVSGDDRPRENRNLNGQLDMCREHAVNKGWKVGAELAEDESGASGYTLDLPELERVFGMAERGDLDILVVREMDRLSQLSSNKCELKKSLGNRACSSST